MDEQYVNDLFNNFYVDGKYPIAIDAQTQLVLGAQYTYQKSIGKEFIGSFSTKHAGVQAAISHGPFGAQLYYTQNGKGFDTQNPFGDHASYLNLMHVAFNTAGEKTWGIGGNVNFASLGAPGLTASAIYASGNDRIDAHDRCGDSRSQGDRPACRLRLRQGHAALRAGGDAARRVAASGRLADRVPASRHPQLRRSLLTPAAAGSWVSPRSAERRQRRE